MAVHAPSLPNVSLPHVSMPHVSLPRVDAPDVSALTDRAAALTDRASSVLADRASGVGDLVGDAWSTGRDRAQDIAAAAIDVIEELPDKAIALAGAVVPALRPSRPSRRPWLLLGAALASVAVVAWIVKRRRAATVEPYAVPAGTAAPAPGVSAAS